MVANFLRFLMLLLSAFAIASAPAGFPPGLVLTLFLFFFAGLLGALGQLKLAGLSLALNSFALAISPATDLSRFHNWNWYSALIYLVPVIVGFTGLLVGIYRLQESQQSQD